MIPETGELAMIPPRRRRDRNQLGLAGAAAGHREHRHRFRGQDIRFAVLDALYIRSEALVVADLDLAAILAERMNRIEMMLAPEPRSPIATDDIEKPSILNFCRLGGEALPARPLAVRQELGGFKKNSHFVFIGALRALRLRGVPRRPPSPSR